MILCHESTQITINLYHYLPNQQLVYSLQPPSTTDISHHKRSICSPCDFPRPFVVSPLWVPLNVAPAPAWTKPFALLQLPRAPHGTPGRSDQRSIRHDSLWKPQNKRCGKYLGNIWTWKRCGNHHRIVHPGNTVRHLFGGYWKLKTS